MRSFHLKNKVLASLSLVLAIFIFCSIFFLVRANRPMYRAKKEAIGIAEELTDLKKVDKFYWYTREKTYFTLMGTTAKEEQIIVIVPQDGEKVTVLDQKSGLSENDVLTKIIEAENPNKIVKINLGMIDDLPTWEVVAQNENNGMDYYLVDFESGKVIDIIKNV